MLDFDKYIKNEKEVTLGCHLKKVLTVMFSGII